MERTKYCKHLELIENYEEAKADNFKGWCIHHRLETHNSDGERRLLDLSETELKALGMYYDRPPEELIFMKSGEHMALHRRGKHSSEDAKKHMSEAKKGHYTSEETKAKIRETKKNIPVETRTRMSEAAKNRPPMSEETKAKIRSTNTGKHHSEETKRKISAANKGEKNGFYGKCHSEETKRKISETLKGNIPWNKGKHHSK